MRARACVHVRDPGCARACACVISSSLLLLFYSGVIQSNVSRLYSADFGVLVFVAKRKKEKEKKKREEKRRRRKKKVCRRDLAGAAKKSRCPHDLNCIAFVMGEEAVGF